MASKIPVAVADGDGIGPEIMAATLKIIEAAAAPLEIKKVEIGEKVYLRGERAGITPETWEVLRHTKAFLKAPITTPQGGGYKSLNVTVRVQLGLYANIRPCVSYDPVVKTKHPGMDVVIIRENEEDLYVGVEYRHTSEVVHALKIITRPGCERIVRYAFEYAKANNRKKVTCFTKDNILKMSDGLFHKVFDEIGTEYPDIEKEHWIVDIGAAKLADTPTAFDVIVMPNLYGDILSDVAAQIAGSVGLAGSANIGRHSAMFEAIHGSAPRRAGQNLANPSGLILASAMMLAHLGEAETANLIHNAWLKTLEDGIHTYDIYKPEISREKVGTKEFAESVIKRLGQKPEIFKAAHYQNNMQSAAICRHPTKKETHNKEVAGVDVFIASEESLSELQRKLEKLATPDFHLKLIANRGTRYWPGEIPDCEPVDEWRCRFMAQNVSRGNQQTQESTHQQIAQLLQRMAEQHVDFVQTEVLFNFDGQPGYTVTQEEQ